MSAIAIQLGASLLAVLLLAVLARQLGLGGDVRIRDQDHARRLAREAEWGFEAVEVGIDRAGIGALLRDDQGRVLLLRRHGAHFAARQVESHKGIRLDRNFITIPACGPNFAGLTLDLGVMAQTWAGSLRRLGG